MWNKVIIIKNIMIMETKEKKEVTNIFKGFIDPLYIVNCENEIGFIF